MLTKTIFRIKHDTNNPYVILSKESLWDKNLSLKAVGLWARLMSRPDDWTIRAAELAKSCDLNEETINKIINELSRNGYAHRRKTKDPETGLYTGWETIIFETKVSVEEIKKMFPDPQKPTSAFPTSAFPTSEISPPTNIDSTNTEKTDISFVADQKSPTPQSLPVEEKIYGASQKAWDASNLLWDRILRLFPNHKLPKLEKWAKEFDLMNRRDNRSWEDVHKAITFVFEDVFWARIIQSAEGFRRNYDKIVAQMTPIDNRGARRQKNRAIAHEAKSIVKDSPEKWKNFYISDNEIVRLDTNEKASLELEPKIFEAAIAKLFGLKVV